MKTVEGAEVYMNDLISKEEIAFIKSKILGILNMVTEDDLYNKEMMRVDLINLVATLDEMEEKIKRITTSYQDIYVEI